MSLKSTFFALSTVILSSLFCILLLESLLRAWYFIHNRSQPPFSYIAQDFGWRPSANVSFTYNRKGYGEIHFSSDREGFRRFGNLDTNKTRVLVLGDSFTQAYHVSDGKAYFDHIAKLNNELEVFAYGVGGYGTVQQSLAFEQYVQEIKPDIVLWQFSGNDFINNDWQLESLSYENNNHMRRPFLEDGEIRHRHPDGVVGWWAERSYLVRRLAVIGSSIGKRTKGTIENELSIDHPHIKRSLTTTKNVLNKISTEYPNIIFASFFAGREYYAWELKAFTEICGIATFQCLPEVHEAIKRAEESGKALYGGKDGHWNEAGHNIAGQVLSKSMQKWLLDE